MSKRMKAREEAESKENLPMKETEAPAGRLQSEQQLANTMSATNVDPGAQPGIVVSENDVPSQVVHTTKVAEILKSNKGLTSGAGSNGVGAAAYRSASYSGEAVIGDMSATTQLQEADRKATRTGKKLDNTLKHINYLYNEQITVKYDESKPLAENPDATQGYNGTYRNEHARTQKNSGFVPADLYYDRSVDEIHQDFIYPTMGQTINDPYASAVIPSTNVDPEAEEDTVAFNYNRGNYIHDTLNVTFNTDGTVQSFSFNNDNIAPTVNDFNIQNISACNGTIDANVAELDRQRVDANAGDELSPKFSPLPRSIESPTSTFSLLRDIEASTGSEVFMAYKKSALAMSYQLNKAAKDGQRIKAPMFEMISGTLSGSATDKTVIGSVDDTENIFDVNLYKQGSPSLMIALYDSPSKYSTKGDLLLQPRGFRMHLQTADNNMNPLRVPKNFVNAVNTNEVFSTIDHEYDPFLPVCISDKAALAQPIDFNAFIENNKPKAFRYSYRNNSNNRYITEVYHPLVKGLYDWFTSMGTKFVKELGNDRTISIKCVHSTTSFSLWSLILLAATPFIIKARLTSMIDVFDYEENFEYPFSQLISLADANPMYSKNYVNNDYNEPVTVKQMLPAVAFKWVFPENMWVAKEYTDSADIVLPWYHNEDQYEYVSGLGLQLKSDGCVMSMPSVRSGSRFGFLDTIYGMTERDVRLCLDRQTVFPGYGDGIVENTGMQAYKYGVTTDGQPVLKYDSSSLTIKKILNTPRELGWVIPAPNGLLTQYITDFTSVNNYITNYISLGDSFEETGVGSFRIRIWKGISNVTPDGILDSGSVNINRAQSLQQVFRTIVNQRMVGNYDAYVNGDIIVSMAALFNNNSNDNPELVANRSLFIPFTQDGVKITDDKRSVASLQKYFWTRVQRLPFAINPFDCSPNNKKLGTEDAIKCDPYDFLYIFGCAGFRASDYNEDSYNREKERLNLGMLFVEDPYFLDSPLYRA